MACESSPWTPSAPAGKSFRLSNSMCAGGRPEMQNGAKNAKRGQGMLMRLEREIPRHENAASSSFGPVQTTELWAKEALINWAVTLSRVLPLVFLRSTAFCRASSHRQPHRSSLPLPRLAGRFGAWFRLRLRRRDQQPSRLARFHIATLVSVANAVSMLAFLGGCRGGGTSRRRTDA